MVQVPSPAAVIFPLESTVATPVLSLYQVGVSVVLLSVICEVCPIAVKVTSPDVSADSAAMGLIS
jgi:hypothetical protein